MEQLLYEGKAKQLFTTEDPNVLRVKYKDDATAFNGEKKAKLEGKGELNNRITAKFFQYLAERGIPNHFIKVISPTEQLVKKMNMIPLEVVVRNRVAGSLIKRIGLSEGFKLSQPIIEFYYKQDELGDPLLNQDHIAVLELATEEQLMEMKKIAKQVNLLLNEWAEQQHIILVDFKLEFGSLDGKILLADEISPDTCRFWDKQSGEILDKDRFRKDLGQVTDAYQEILLRLGGNEDV
ncbi:phosphoribosylaminoimidazolesuccinocarboxamide synthase [Thermoflavimicrobium daqui]|jgi:phosphoribosylaminoimidazole-succinocarboxamide synthase|uniref:Phosphoribosylaminoimidazole-succinocarboxamide synthase n=1 Tax=Thermoflavimicrobium daqui TaxID=2137476 RepID=A0A364K184_9BACL|nr:phosphoribosylaminoimidazolesuccinocarboxamide synthase [Thermoflavimicrobium daqui]RAL21459.1 phosphoribosylaminoimidazolesuccinocarboxamide synthase [Thermoflavimicrobium daqui]